MNTKYQHKEIEQKWQEKWAEEGLYKFSLDPKKKKFYTLVEFPYTSGDLHIGHWFAFSTPDVVARYKRMNGLNVFFPNGYDAFGLPAENAAIKRGIHPKEWTLGNIDNMMKQFATMGTMIDWSHSVVTCLPEYYRWNQWIFLKMYEKGIAYRGKALSNWCPIDKTVLADEHVEAGKCWRCGATVEKKEVEQWFIKITDYADRLIWPDSAKASTGKPENPKVDWPKSVRDGQNNWIGRSEGMLIKFNVKRLTLNVEVFTTRPETTDGATFLVLAPEHELVEKLTTQEQKETVESYVKKTVSKSELERKENKEKTGVFTGSYVINPVTKKEMSVWIADYVLVGYGTGAVMAVPAADERDREFAQKYKLPIEKTSFKAQPKGEKKVNYHIRDWSVSRQRYWGTPIPMVHCEKCGIVPISYENLPVELPYKVNFMPTGKPPLATNEKWLSVKCPKCGEKAKRDAETLDTFFDSSWYFFRYLSPKYEKGPFDQKITERLMPVDVYFGGSEHILGHTLYARFFTKFFKDIGLTKIDEFTQKRIQHGDVLGPDGARMSKSRGNVINPDDVVAEYGADTTRLYLCFMMPYDGTAPWSTEAIQGIYRFLQRVWKLSSSVIPSVSEGSSLDSSPAGRGQNDLTIMHKTIKKVTEDIETIKLNTAIAALMEWLNYLTKKPYVTGYELRVMLLLLAPFAPHLTEELWQSSKFKVQSLKFESVHLQPWPKYDEKYLKEDKINLPVQVDGKLRGVITIATDHTEAVVTEMALKDPKIANYLRGKKYKTIYIKGKIFNFILT